MDGDVRLRRPGLFVGGVLLAAFGLLFLSLGAAHWFPVVLLLLGITSCVLAFVGGAAEVVEGPGIVIEEAQHEDLRSHLAELDRLRDDGVLTAAEHKRKRKALIDAWGLPS